MLNPPFGFGTLSKTMPVRQYPSATILGFLQILKCRGVNIVADRLAGAYDLYPPPTQPKKSFKIDKTFLGELIEVSIICAYPSMVACMRLKPAMSVGLLVG